MAYWLVGEAPTTTVEQPEAVLTPDDTGRPSLANRLLQMTGWTIGEFKAVFDVRRTVWKRPWPLWLDEGRQRAASIGEDARVAIGVVVVGQMAAAAFGLAGESPFEWAGKYAVVPHPCPTRIARTWNVPGTREKAQAFFAQILKTYRARNRSRSRPGRAGSGARRRRA